MDNRDSAGTPGATLALRIFSWVWVRQGWKCSIYIMRGNKQLIDGNRAYDERPTSVDIRRPRDQSRQQPIDSTDTRDGRQVNVRTSFTSNASTTTRRSNPTWQAHSPTGLQAPNFTAAQLTRNARTFCEITRNAPLP